MQRDLLGMILLVVACGGGPDTTTSPTNTDSTTDPTTEPTTEPTTDPTTEPTEPLEAFVGSPCEVDADCPYDGGRCLVDQDGFPGGSCSVACDAFCPDAVGFPTTFCVDGADLEVDAAPDLGGDGVCMSRCDFGAYPFDGCREGYGCVELPRVSDEDTRAYTCVPGASALSPCLEGLAARGVPFAPILLPDRVPEGAPDLTCHVEEPIVFYSGYRGVDLVFYEGSAPGTLRGACEMGHALADTIDDVEPRGVVTLRHLGSYVCRVIAGTSRLSRHAYGDALDISGFDFDDGSRLTLLEDWEHETTEFSTDGAAWLYDTAHGWHEDQIWSVILTPNYNLAHDNHFHVDLTPGSDFIGFAEPGYFGPMPVAE